MSRRTSALLLLSASLLLHPVVLRAQTTFTWTGNGTNSYLSTAENWQGGVAPVLENGLDNLVFPATYRNFINFYSPQVYGLTVTGNYFFQGSESYLHLLAGGLNYTASGNSRLTFGQWGGIDLAANQTWQIGTNGTVEAYYLTGTGSLNKTGGGTLVILDPGNSGWTGGLTLSGGRVVIGGDYYSSSALGSGTLTFNGGTLVATQLNGYSDDSTFLYNNVVSNGLISTVNKEVELHLGYHGEGYSTILLNANTTVTAKGRMLLLEGNITEAEAAGRSLTIDGPGAVVLTGYNSYTGGTTVNNGILVFGQAPSIPAVNLGSGSAGKITVAANGYVGFGDQNYSEGNVQASFLDQFNKAASAGSIGFDTDPNNSSPNQFYGSLDLTGFNASARLGSATRAIIQGTITPQGTDYRFGGGGGRLQVDSYLSGTGNVVLDSPADRPLTVRFTNAENDFSGNVSVTNSGAVFSAFALPNTASFTLAAGAYAGSEDSSFTASPSAINAYLARFGAGTPGIIGFDNDPAASTARVVDLTGANLGSLTGGGYLGTASILYDLYGDPTGPGVQFTGTIAPNSDGVHRFAAYKGGGLQVTGTLTGNSLVIGHPNSLGAFGDRNNEEYSNVLIDGDNTGHLASGTTLYGGRLFLGQTNGTIGTDATSALGAGALTVAPVGFTIDEGDNVSAPSPMLATFAGGLIFANAIHVNAPELSLGGDHNFTLNGTIDGTGSLYVGEDTSGSFILTLGGNNAYSGGTYVSEGATIVANHNNALGTGKLSFGNSSEGRVEFHTAAPVIRGLDSNDYGNLSLWANDTVLTIDQSFGSRFVGEIRSESGNGAFQLVKTGFGTLRLDSNGNDYAGLYGYGGVSTMISGNPVNVGLIVQQGALVITPNFYIEDSSPTAWVHGGALVLDGNASFNNPIIVDNNGKLAGSGYFKNVSIGTGATISPGWSGNGNLGNLHFEHLELNSGGTLEWHIQNPAETGGGRDLVEVSSNSGQTLVINADAAGKFNLRIISLTLAGGNGALANVDPNHGLYAWTLINFDTLQVPSNLDVFNPAAFQLDVSGFSTAQGTGNQAGTFSVFQQGNQLMLGFTPVPEPSTWALLALGLGTLGLTLRRRRA